MINLDFLFFNLFVPVPSIWDDILEYFSLGSVAHLQGLKGHNYPLSLLLDISATFSNNKK